MLTEKKIEAKLVKWCRENGIYTRKFVSPANRGVPDRLFVYKGRVLFMELKRPGNVPTRLQLHEIDQLHKAGASALVATGFEEATLKLFGFFLLDFPQPRQIDPTDLI